MPNLDRLRRTSLLTLLFLLPFERIPSADIAGVTLRPSLIAGGILILSSIPLFWQQRHKLLESPWRWLWLFLLASLLSAGVALSPKRSLLVLLFYAFVSLLAASIFVSFERQKIGSYLKYLFLGSIVTSIFGLYQYVGDLAGLPTPLTGLRERYTKVVFGFPRIQSTALEPLYFASYLTLPISLVVSTFIRKAETKRAVLLFLLLTVGWMTLSRGGFAAFFIILLSFLMVLVKRKDFKKVGGLTALSLLSVIAAVGLIAFAAAFDPFGVQDKISTFSGQTTNVTDGGSVSERALQRQLAIESFKSSPVLGIGPGNFGVYANRKDPANFPDHSGIVNNEILELLAETGIIGTAILTLFAATLFLRAWLNYPGKERDEQMLILALLFWLLAVGVQYQTFSTLYITHIWTGIGLLAGAAFKERRVKSV
jgi:O-antigen ligase